ncbi:MAG: HNH endonuclease [Pseudomonadota bacterium]
MIADAAETLAEPTKQFNPYLQRFKTLEQRFFEKVNKDGPIPPHRPELGKCWVWMAGRLQEYGCFKGNGKMQKAHRVSWELHNGKIPDGLFACHKCDYPPCVNPHHLFLGTTQDNTSDRTKKGRSARGDISGLRQHPERAARGDNHGSKTRPETTLKGEKNPNAKITEADVIEIRRLAGSAPKKEIAKRYGISAGMAGYIINRKSWRHIR